MQTPARLLTNVQILRGLAALMVAASHIGNTFVGQNLINPIPALPIGYFGVDLFFVISGFIMLHSTTGDESPSRSGQFFLRRLIRIVPLYWIMVTGAMAIMLWQNRKNGIGEHEWWHVAASYAFVPFPTLDDVMDFYPILVQGWTLEYEMAFYVCFACAMFLPSRFRFPVLSAFMVGLVVAGTIWNFPPPLLYWARSNTLEFVLGMAIAQAFASGFRFRSGVALGIAGLGAVMAVAFAPYSDDWDVIRGLGWGLPAVLIVGAAVLVKPFHANVLTKAFESLGDASYSLYLVHIFVFDGFVIVFQNALQTQEIRFRTLIAIMLVGAIGISFVLYYLVERPITRALQRRLVGRTSTIPAALTA